MRAHLPLAFALSSLAMSACAGDPPLPPRAAWLNAAGARALSLGDLSTAEANLSVALEYSPRFVEAWVNLGYVELRRGAFEQARRDFERARSLNADVPAPHHALGLLADARGDGFEAEARYRDALAVDPGFTPARANLARRLFDRGQYEDAREQFQRLRGVDPRSGDAWAGEAEALLQLDREADAAAAVGLGRAAAGDAPALALVAARLALAAGQWAEAEATLAPVVGGPDRPCAAAAWAWIAVARAGQGDLPGARQAAGAARRLDPSHPLAAYAERLAAGAR